jgi:hypothetical protein
MLRAIGPWNNTRGNKPIIRTQIINKEIIALRISFLSTILGILTIGGLGYKTFGNVFIKWN